METRLSNTELKETFSHGNEAILCIENDHFIEANQTALDLIGVSSLKIFQSLHPAMISPEFQADGNSSKSKADEIFSTLKESGSMRFKWQHIKLDGSPFDVEVTLRLRDEDGHFYTDVHWRPLHRS